MWYSYDPPTPNTIHGRVAAQAKYVGTVDPEDQSVALQTTACSIRNMQPPKICDAGFGTNAQGPFQTGQVVVCNTDQCMGHQYISKPCCNTDQVDFYGEAGAVIYHQFSPEIDKKVGPLSAVTCKSCEGGCAGGTSAAAVRVLPIGSQPPLLARSIEPLAADFVLTRVERQGEIDYLMDEWALVSFEESAGTLSEVRSSSSMDLASWLRVPRSPTPELALGPAGGGSPEAGTSLVVMVPHHPNEMRSIPLPSAALHRSWLPGSRGLRTLAVRVDFAEDRTLQTLELLYQDGEVGAMELAFLRNNLYLRYRSDKLHRTILYAVLHVGARGVAIESSFTLLPECCGGMPQNPPWGV